MKKFFSHTVTKSLVFLLLPLAYTTMFSIAISNVVNESTKNDLLVWSFITFILHIIALAVYGFAEERQKKQVDDLQSELSKLPQEMTNIAPMLYAYNKVILDNANELYDIVKTKKGHSDIQNWNWMQSRGDDICSAIYTFVLKIAEAGENFSVSMMFKMIENGVSGYTMMSRCSYDACHVPKIYRSFVAETDAADMYYKKVFDENPSRPKILLNKKEIQEAFNKTNNVDYSQYIALPISCKGKTVGIIQIVAYENSHISTKRNELKRLCNNYFSIAQSIMLLSDKSENIKQII